MDTTQANKKLRKVDDHVKKKTKYVKIYSIYLIFAFKTRMNAKSKYPICNIV